MAGEEALAPPTMQNALAAFAYEELDLGAYRLQFGGRIEHNDFHPEGRAEPEHAHEAEEERKHEGFKPDEVRDRGFTGATGSVGLHMNLGDTSAFVVNFTRSYRAPALEEFYNFGPHVGNLAFEIGNPHLGRESTVGMDLSLRSQSPRVQGDINFYYYSIDNFVFPSFTGEVENGLRVADFLQGNARFMVMDARGGFRVHEHALLKLDIGYVDAELTHTGESLPRIPPLHGRVSLEIPCGGLTVKPELVWAAKQDQISGAETVTDGYTVLNLNASYLLARPHAAHIFSVKAYNITNQLYRIHTSFIKDLASEMGRGMKFTYSLRFF